MGRVDEALRRAAETAAQDDEASGSHTTTQLIDDIDVLAREAFPIEIEEHRKPARPTLSSVPAPAPVSPAPATPAAAAAPAVATEPMARVPAPAASAMPRARTRGGTFERIDSSLTGKVVVDADISPASLEQYRRMAATLHHSQASNGLKVVMVTSAMMGDGKTLTSSNLAMTLSESYKKNVLLIDGDLRRPALHTLFRLDSSPGLSEGLVASEDQRLPVRQVSPRLGVLTAGRPSSDPIASLTSRRMQRVIEEARDAFDWVVIDTPPIALLTDANLLATMADGVILVVRAGGTPWDLAQRAVETLGRDRILGVVLNRSSAPSNDSGYGYYYAAPSTDLTPSP